MQSGTNSLFEEQNMASSKQFSPDSLYLLNNSNNRRVLTAPAGPLSEFGKFKRDKQFILLEQFMISYNQLIHKSYEKYDTETDEGQTSFRNYLEHLELLFPAFKAHSRDRSYRNSFSKAYSTLYNEGELCYLTEIWDSAQEGFAYLYVNGQKYPFSQQVLNYGSKLVSDNYKLQHIINSAYIKILEQVPQSLDLILKQITFVLQQFDICWTTYEEKYINQLMSVEQQAKQIIIRAIQLERSLSTEEVGNKLKFKLGTKSPLFYEIRDKLIFQISKINSVANEEGKGRDDLHPDILYQAEGIVRKVTQQQSKAARVIAQKIKFSFFRIREILRKYDTCIDQIDPQLKQNQDLVEALMQYETSWQKGKAYFLDANKLKTFIEFTNVIETATQKYESFKQQLEYRSAQVFMIIPSLVVLKVLDEESMHFFEYFLNENPNNLKQCYERVKQPFKKWKMNFRQKYLYFNTVEKELMGLEQNNPEKRAAEQDEDFHFIISNIKQIAINMQRFSPVDWNSLLEAALIDS